MKTSGKETTRAYKTRNRADLVKPAARSSITWSVYLIRASGGVIYTGIATDVERRLDEHRAGRGAKYLRGRGPLEIVFRRGLGDRSLASRVERRLKRMTKEEKEALVRSAPSRRQLLKTLKQVDRR